MIDDIVDKHVGQSKLGVTVKLWFTRVCSEDLLRAMWKVQRVWIHTKVAAAITPIEM
jgi:hypothetical protein